jgi:phytanoyl-CoA hydroxylase
MEDVALRAAPAGTAEGHNETSFTPPFTDPEAIREFFRREGYLIIRGLVPPPLCERAREAFVRDVRPSGAYFIRHKSGRYERHVINECGHMQYPIMNIQDLNARRFRAFRRSGLDVLTHPNVQAITGLLFGEPGKVVHTMYFDANQATWAHRDSHYIDSEETGRMLGVWVAVDDVHPGAGRFYVHARSNRGETPLEWGVDSLDPNSDEYKARIVQFMEESGFPRVAPLLQRGDAVVFSGLTVHGSLETSVPGHPRRCLTAHFIPASHHYRWFRRWRGRGRFAAHNGVAVAHHGEQTGWKTQWRLQARRLLGERLRQLRSLRQRLKGRRPTT